MALEVEVRLAREKYTHGLLYQPGTATVAQQDLGAQLLAADNGHQVRPNHEQEWTNNHSHPHLNH